jgi:hypothetical protein
VSLPSPDWFAVVYSIFVADADGIHCHLGVAVGGDPPQWPGSQVYVLPIRLGNLVLGAPFVHRGSIDCLL